MGEEVLKRMPLRRQAEAEVHDKPFGCGLASGRGSKFACEWRGQRECPNQCAVEAVPCGTCGAVEGAQKRGRGDCLDRFSRHKRVYRLRETRPKTCFLFELQVFYRNAI